MVDDAAPSPVEFTVRTVRSGWRTARTLYYANSTSWQALKSGALVFLGLFCWSAGNVLLSYRPDWGFLHYVVAYGFLLAPYGPVHHVVVIPLSLRLRRRADRFSRVGRRLPLAMLVAFLAGVVVLGAVAPAGMVVDFRSTLEEGGVDVNPDLLCTKATQGSTTTIHCHLTESEGIDAVVVESGGRQLARDDEPPFDFTVREGELEEVVGQKQFQVVLLDGEGETLRVYTRTAGMIREG